MNLCGITEKSVIPKQDAIKVTHVALLVQFELKLAFIYLISNSTHCEHNMLSNRIHVTPFYTPSRHRATLDPVDISHILLIYLIHLCFIVINIVIERPYHTRLIRYPLVALCLVSTNR